MICKDTEADSENQMKCSRTKLHEKTWSCLFSDFAQAHYFNSHFLNQTTKKAYYHYSMFEILPSQKVTVTLSLLTSHLSKGDHISGGISVFNETVNS